MTVRRIKTYSGDSGVVYQYYFLRSRPRRRLLGRGGTGFLFSVSSDRKTSFVVEVVVEESAVARWARNHDRPLGDTEKYAAAKMRLFQAFDESSRPEQLAHIRVSASNIESVLAPLGLDD